MLSVPLILLLMLTVCASLRCHQCNGWHGKMPTRENTLNTCDNRNNQCETPQFCVKILDSMNPGAPYVTYKSDCYYAPTIQVNPTNLSQIQTRGCYPFQDGSAPVKKWWYCFCNDRDYCNSSQTLLSPVLFVFMIIHVFVVF